MCQLWLCALENLDPYGRPNHGRSGRREELGVRTQIIDIDFGAIMERMRRAVTSGRKGIEGAIEETENLDFIRGEAQFIDDRTLEVGRSKNKR